MVVVAVVVAINAAALQPEQQQKPLGIGGTLNGRLVGRSHCHLR